MLSWAQMTHNGVFFIGLGSKETNLGSLWSVWGQKSWNWGLCHWFWGRKAQIWVFEILGSGQKVEVGTSGLKSE